MGVRTADDVLALPVRVRGIELGRPVDALVDVDGRRVLGLDVLCGDGRHRFLPLAVARIDRDEIAIASPLLLLDFDQLTFYREQAAALGAMRGAAVGEAGVLRDLVVDGAGVIAELVVDAGAARRRIPLDGLTLPMARCA